MNVKLIIEYVYNVGGEELMLQVLKENGGIPEGEFALDEVYVDIPLEKVKEYIPKFTIEEYAALCQEKYSYWRDENGNNRLFS